PVFDAFDTVHDCLAVLTGAVASATFDKARMAEALQSGYLAATEVADWLATRGVPFREAHHITGKLVDQAHRSDKTLAELPLETYREAHASFDASIFDALDMETAIERRDVLGAPARRRVMKAIDELRGRLEARRGS
ncbi:MAG: argininosuccinate lyase, partial [Myxococcales bacterium]|nr:argininosuccinate lyase [Myxococcales bacterium]